MKEKQLTVTEKLWMKINVFNRKKYKCQNYATGMRVKLYFSHFFVFLSSQELYHMSSSIPDKH